MLVTVLIVMVTMVVILAVTAQLALSSRRSTVAQDTVVRASYAAESGIARAQAQLNVANTLLQDDNLQIPTTTTSSQMLTDITNLCGGTVLQITAINNVLCKAGNLSTGLLGSLSASTLQSGNRLDFLVKYVPVSAFAQAGYPAADSNAARTFWAQMFSSDGKTLTGGASGTAYKSSVRLVLSQVQQLAQDSYTLNILVPDVNALGTPETGSSRKLTMGPNTVTPYQLTIGRDSFAKYALFTNRHYSSSSEESGCASNPNNCSRITFTSNTLFSGPVHTNSNFNFQGTPYFGGKLTSSGCPAGQIATDASGNDYCKSGTKPGAYFFTTTWVSKGAMSPNDQAPVVTACASYDRYGRCTSSNTTNPQALGGADWNRSFIPLPKNTYNQAAQALQGGISIPSGVVSNMTLQATNVSIGGAATSVQRITYTVGSATTDMVVDASNNVYVLVGGVWTRASQNAITGVWSAGGSGTKFNGVVYAKAGINNLNGPARTTANNPATAPAALASFSQITLASDGDIDITSDLKYADPPCTGSNSASGGTFVAAPCNNQNAKNILGIYSSGGDVSIISPSSSNKPCTATDKYGNCTASASAKNDVTIQAVLMASQGRVTVDGFDQGAADNSLGKVHLMGGIIENYYGPFGITDGRGYGRDFVYDQRTSEGLTPPSFPTQQTWSASLDRPMKLDQAGYQLQKGQ